MKQWETEATRELSAMIYELAYSQYESKEALASRLRAVAEAIELVSTPTISHAYTGRIRNRRHDQLHHTRKRQMQLLQPLGEDDPQQ